jgi:hypothetical protein
MTDKAPPIKFAGLFDNEVTLTNVPAEIWLNTGYAVCDTTEDEMDFDTMFSVEEYVHIGRYNELREAVDMALEWFARFPGEWAGPAKATINALRAAMDGSK